MSDHFWLRQAQLERIKPYLPLSHGIPRVDDRRVVSGIVHVIRHGLRWQDAPQKTLIPETGMAERRFHETRRDKVRWPAIWIWTP